jgi:hypothetical protein
VWGVPRHHHPTPPPPFLHVCVSGAVDTVTRLTPPPLNVCVSGWVETVMCGGGEGEGGGHNHVVGASTPNPLSPYATHRCRYSPPPFSCSRQ